jgi:uncharacterized membrane protein YqiK
MEERAEQDAKAERDMKEVKDKKKAAEKEAQKKDKLAKAAAEKVAEKEAKDKEKQAGMRRGGVQPLPYLGNPVPPDLRSVRVCAYYNTQRGCDKGSNCRWVLLF